MMMIVSKFEYQTLGVELLESLVITLYSLFT